MNAPHLQGLRIFAFLAFALFVLWACHLGNEEKTEEIFTFTTLADSLKGSDLALILLKTPSGEVIDTLFEGPVTPDTRFEALPARHFDGGKVIVVIEGYKDGAINYKIEKTYTGASGKVDSTIIIIARPVTGDRVDSVSISPDTLRVTAHGAQAQLIANVHPDTLSQDVTWKALNTAVATVSTAGKVSGLQAGTGRMVATSALDGRTSDTAVVIVAAAPKVESVKIDRAVLEIYLGGTAEPLVVQVLPLGANPEVGFSIADSSVAEIVDGKVKGLKDGRTKVNVRSREDSSKSASLEVVVLPKPSDPVDSVAVSPDTLRLYTGGESLSMTAVLHPKTLPARLSWRTASPAIASVDTTGKVSPVSQGQTFVSAISLADSTRRDSAVVIVKRDPPRIQIGSDTTISVGQTLAYLPNITQDYGLTTMVRWDLDGDGEWDDSSANPKSVSYRYSEVKEYRTCFSARDTEGNDTTVTRRVRSVSGPVILFSQPADGFHTNQSPITVAWSVDGVPQSSSEPLKAGANTIPRSATNGAGETFSASITVHYDTIPPARPLVKGPSGPVSTLRPAWSWEPAGGGNGTFRYRLDNDNFTVGATVVSDTTFTPGADLAEGPHTLYVQERDHAGNWSSSGSFSVRIDTTPPDAPTVSGPATPTNDDTPTWTWTPGSGGIGRFRYRLNDTNMTGGTATPLLVHTPASLAAGTYTLYVQESDSAGNWSPRGSYTLVIDRTPPSPPNLNASTPRSPLNTLRPTWSWTTGGGGDGTYQVKVGDDNFSTGATTVSATTYSPPADLGQGAQTLYVREGDAALNWSPPASRTLFLAPRDTLEKLGFSAGGGTAPIILVTATGVVYAAYEDHNTRQAVVKRYEPGTDSWVDAGTNLGVSFLNDFALGPGDVPYIVGPNHVKRLSGSVWQDVGDSETNATRLSGNGHSLAFTSTGTPYLAFLDAANGYKVALMRFSGTGWDLANITRVGGEPFQIELAIAANNRPYIAFLDLVDVSVFVVTTDPAIFTADWDTLGSGPVYNDNIIDLRLKAYSNILYLGLSSYADNFRLYSSVGGAFASIHTASGKDFDIAVSSAGVPYVAYAKPESPSDQITVMGRINSTWVNIGAVLQSAGGMLTPSLAVTGDGVPYVGFHDQAQGGKPSVIRTSFDP